MIATEAIVDEIRELAMSGGSRALTDLSLTGISLPAAVSLCLSLHLWERKGTPVPGSFCQRAVDLAPLAEAQAVFLGRTGGMLPDDDPFRRTTVEFFPLTCPRAFPSLPWDNYRQRFKKAMTSAGLDRVGRNLRPHSFRHTLNTILRGSGTDPALIRESLGWSDEQTQNRYTHWHPEHFDEQRKRLDELFK